MPYPIRDVIYSSRRKSSGEAQAGLDPRPEPLTTACKRKNRQWLFPAYQKRRGRHERDPQRGPARPPREIKTTLSRIEATLAATLPHLATKVELADKPSHGYLWGVMPALVGAQAVALAAAALIFSILQARPAPVPHASAAAAFVARRQTARQGRP
jgi:hypothetical protein